MSSPASPTSLAHEPHAPFSDVEVDAHPAPDGDGADESIEKSGSEHPSSPSVASSASTSPKPDRNDDDASSESEAADGLSSPDLELPIQIHSRPGTPLLPLILSLPGPLIDIDTGTMDDAIERHFLTEAEELGLDVPPEPKSILKASQNNDSTATVSSSSPETQTIPSRASESTRPTSRSSSINNNNNNNNRPTTATKAPKPKSVPSTPKQPSHKKKPHSSRPPVPPPEPPEPPSDRLAGLSVSSDGGSSRMVRGLKRFSNYTKRRTMMLNKTIPMPSDASVHSSEKDTASDPGTISGPTISAVELDGVDENESTAASKPRRKQIPSALPSVVETSSFISTSPRSPKSPGLGGLNPDEAKEYDSEEAKQRSLRSRHLQAIRLHQLDEQSEFLEYFFGVFDKVRSKYIKEREEAEKEYMRDRKVVEERHSEQHQEMEHRHLNKEMDLQHSLEQERQACETKLKHMDAYCNGRPGSEEEDAPRRKVTEEDYRKLLHQYHIRQTMGGLHDSKIKVLRERQAKQMERLTDNDEEELSVMKERWNEEEARRNSAQNAEEEKIRNEFDLKKHRLIWRWKLMETVERRKLELETGETYGELPEVQWGEEEWLHTAL